MATEEDRLLFCNEHIKTLKEIKQLIETLEIKQPTVEKKSGVTQAQYSKETCPEMQKVEHPYIPNVNLYSKPQLKVVVTKVTVDGRLGDKIRPVEYTFVDPPLKVPPWFRPRYNSFELRSGILYQSCDCCKKNGLQDDCKRWDCSGRPECTSKPSPVCPPSTEISMEGIRKPNAFVNPLLASNISKKEIPVIRENS